MKNVFMRSVKWVMPALISGLALVGCGGGSSNFASPSFTLGGTVSGLDSSHSVQLTVSGTSNTVTVSQNGAFQLPNTIPFNGSYAVTVAQQPVGQTCTVSNGTGAGVVANVSNVSVLCSDNTYPVSGTVTGLSAGHSLVIQNNSANSTTVSGSTFAFTTPVVYNSSYAVTVLSQPTGETCTVNNGTGAGVVANITNVNIVCAINTYTISGTVSGLDSGQQVTLNNNSANPTILTTNGNFSFSVPVTYNGSYAVTVGTQPLNQTCSVINSTGAGVVANISNVAVSCAGDTYTISGTVSGLDSGNQVTLNNNSGNPTMVTSNGNFSFSTPVTYNGSYAVTVGTQPTGQTCTVNNATGAGISANITNIAISCSNQTYSVSGSVSGLSNGTQVTLNNNAANPTSVASNGNFTFSTPVTYRSNYAVTVGTQPTGETCSVSHGTGTMGAANVSNVAVSCALNGYTIGGTLTGLTNGAQITLYDNGGDALVLSANGNFNFATPVAPGGTYAVTVNQQPSGETCTVTNGTGTDSANVTNISISCGIVIAVDFTGSGDTAAQVSAVYLSSTPSITSGSFGFVTTANNGGRFSGTYLPGNYYLVVQLSPTVASCQVDAQLPNITFNSGGVGPYINNGNQAIIPFTLISGGEAILLACN